MSGTAQMLRRLALALGIVMCLTGCLFPIPPHSMMARKNIGEGVPNFIVRGATTREEVLLRLGEPDGFEKTGAGGEWMSWGTARSHGGVGFVVVAGTGGAAAGGMMATYRRLVIDFDTNGVVREAHYDVSTCMVAAFVGDHASSESEPCLDVLAHQHVTGGEQADPCPELPRPPFSTVYTTEARDKRDDACARGARR